MDNEYRHSKDNCIVSQLPLCFCPRYRRKIFVNSEVDARFKALVQEIAKENEWNIIAIETDKDHCHLLINVQPTYSPSKIMKIIKR